MIAHRQPETVTSHVTERLLRCSRSQENRRVPHVVANDSDLFSCQIPPRWIIAYARHCGEDQLREGGALPVRWAKFAFSYWINLLRLAPHVKPNGMTMLLHKLGPPYPSACQRQQDQLEYLKRGLIAQPGDPANS